MRANADCFEEMFWSSLRSPWLLLIGAGKFSTKLLAIALGPPVLGRGKRYFSAASESGEIWFIWITLLGNGFPLRSFTALGKYTERSPWRMASEGTLSESTVSRGSRRPSYVRKKNVLSWPLY